MKRIEEWIFFVIVLSILFFGAFTLVKNTHSFSSYENRSLAQFPHLTVDNFLNGDYQDALEKAISDQFFTGSEIRINYRQAITNLPLFGLDKMVCEGNYLELANSIDRHRAIYNCEDYMVYFPELLSENKRSIFEKNIAKYNNMNKVSDMYYYFVNDSSIMNFSAGEKTTDYVKLLKNGLKGKYHLASFEYKDWEDYKKYFYKNDHHWNYNGSYRGYLEIAKLLHISKTVKPVDSFTVQEPYFGSFATTTQNYNYPDVLTINTFDIPDHDVLVNGEKTTYNHIDECRDHSYNYSSTLSLYQLCYGDNIGEVVFDFHQSKKENLLVIANSYSNPINELIAMNYNKTFVVDLRHYKEQFGYDFDLEDYLRRNHIKKTLMIMSPTFVRNENTNQGLKP